MIGAQIPELGSVEVVGRLVLAAVLGGVIGAERELDGQDAGLRTHFLLAVGAALFGAISVGAFTDFSENPALTNVRYDPTRVASYVAAGIGFIGGGTIIKRRGSVSGITTATSLWAAAAIGLAAGLGFWVGALTTAVLVLVALRGLKPLSKWMERRATGAPPGELAAGDKPPSGGS